MRNKIQDISLATKDNPIIFRGLCKFDGYQTILIQTTSGGFVEWKCKDCGRTRVLEEYYFRNNADFVFLCNDCSSELVRDRDKNTNYILRCNCCHYTIKLADIVPDDC